MTFKVYLHSEKCACKSNATSSLFMFSLMTCVKIPCKTKSGLENLFQTETWDLPNVDSKVVLPPILNPTAL